MYLQDLPICSLALWVVETWWYDLPQNKPERMISMVFEFIRNVNVWSRYEMQLYDDVYT